MPSFFSSEQAKERILDLYHEKLNQLAVSYEFRTIETSFGDTNVIITGNPSSRPLVLLHGSNGCAPVAIEACIELVDYFRIYAVDVVGQPNMSAESRPDMNGDAYGQWMYEVLSCLHVRDAILAGFSFGGFVCLKTLAFDEKHIARAFLMMPAGIVNGNPFEAIRKVFLPMKMYMWKKKAKYVDRFLSALFTENDKFAKAFLAEVFLHFKMDFTQVPLIKKENAAKIKTPLHLITASDDLFFPGPKMLKRASAIFPSLAECMLMENTKHVPGRAGNIEIADFIKKHSI